MEDKDMTLTQTVFKHLVKSIQKPKKA